MTVHILSAGDGYAYYTNEVATGDVKRESGRDLGDYYTADGNPPGVWVGSGLDQLGVSGQVTEAQMKALYGEGLHPDADAMIAAAIANGATAAQATKAARLGRAYYGFTQGATDLQAAIDEGYARFERENHRAPDADERRRIRVREGAQAFRTAKLREPADKEELGLFITAATRPTAQAVAGFDLVFSPAKSVSVLWALGDTDTRKAIEAAHEAAIEDSIRYLEREAIATRAGTNGVAQIDVMGGLIATRFRHYDSRTGDPQLHDHVVVANKVRGSDGKWRTIDSKLLHRQGVAASEFYNARVMERVTDALGLATELRVVTAGKRPVVELKGVDEDLAALFSSRSASIKAAVSRLEAEYFDTHGRTPDLKARVAIAQQATLDTRPEKAHARSLSELRAQWRATAVAAVGDWRVSGILAHAQRAAATPVLRDPDARTSYTLGQAAESVLGTVAEQRAVWGPHMVEAEARRFVAAQAAAGIDVQASVEEITRAALGASIAVTPPGPHAAFEPLTRADGASIYEHKGRTLLTSQTILDAEDILLAGGREAAPAPVTAAVFERVAARENASLRAEGKALDAGQLAMAQAFACGERRLIIGIGAAGTGKTTALQVAARAVEEQGGQVVGLAYSASAAKILGDAAGIPSHTLHSFLHTAPTLRELERDDSPLGLLNKGDVVVVDEAGMAGSVNLARLLLIAWRDGAHVRLLGDDRQLGAVEAGGALRLLEREIGAVQLDALYRFSNRDEAAASLLLRDPTRTEDPFAWYTAQGRVTGGDVDRMNGDVFAAWQRDTHAGLSSLMIASSAEVVSELNLRAQAFRMSSGAITADAGVQLRAGLDAHRGDIIVTRKNNRRITVNRGRDVVKNGDLWAVAHVNDDGSLDVVHVDHGGKVTLPAGYVSKHVDLGYAITVHRSQGMTVDTAHMMADAATARESAYVGLTRGRLGNFLYVVTELAEAVSDVLGRIAENYDGMLSAHDTIRAEQERVDNLPVLVDQYRDATERFALHRHRNLASQVLFGQDGHELTTADSFGAVSAALTRAEHLRLDPGTLLATVAGQRELASSDDVGAVMSYRLEKYLEDRGEGMLRTALGEAVTEQLAGLDSYDQVHDALHRLEARGEDVVATVREAWFEDSIDPTLDAGQVLVDRVNEHLAVVPAPHEDLALPKWVAAPVSPYTAVDDAHWVDHLQERYDHLVVHFEQRREILAAEPPAWAAELGPLPQEPARRDSWTQLAAEIDVFRERYNITTPDAIPAEYQTDATGKDLAARAAQLRTQAAAAAEKASTTEAIEAMAARARARTQAAEDALRRTGTTVAPRTSTPDPTLADDRDTTRGRDDGLDR